MTISVSQRPQVAPAALLEIEKTAAVMKAAILAGRRKRCKDASMEDLSGFPAVAVGTTGQSHSGAVAQDHCLARVDRQLGRRVVSTGKIITEPLEPPWSPSFMAERVEGASPISVSICEKPFSPVPRFACGTPPWA